MTEAKYLKENLREMQKIMISLPLKKFETKSLRHSLRMSKINEYSDGEIITKENDEDPYIYFLLSGKARLEKKGENTELIDRPGEIFGEVKILENLVRSGDVFAKEEAVCLVVNTSSYSMRMTSNEGADILLLLYRVFMEYLAIRLRLLTEELVKTKKEIERLRR